MGYDQVGGASYGPYQLSTKTGKLGEFLESPGVKEAFGNLTPGTPEFKTKWETMSNDPAFIEKQKEFMFKDYIRTRDYLINAYGIDPSTDAGLANSVFSLADQHGVGGAKSILDTVLAANPNPSAKDLVPGLYDERMRIQSDGKLAHFPNSTPAVQRSVFNRFQNENQDALGMVGAPVDLNSLPARAYR